MTTGEIAPAPRRGCRRACGATLPGRYYTDPTIFAAEQALIFETTGSAPCSPPTSRPPAPSRPSRSGGRASSSPADATARSTPTSTSAATAGARLCTEDKGAVRRSFQCPYHAWTYGLDGKLIAAPNIGEMPDVDRVEFGLNRVHVREWLGYVWLCLAEEPPSFEDDGGRRRRRAAGRPRRDRRLPGGGPEAGTAHRVRRGGELEADRRELHGVLPLRDDPPRAHRGPARSSPTGSPRSTSSATAPHSATTSRASPSTARKASIAFPAWPRTRTGAITPSPSGPRCSSISSPTTSCSTACSRSRLTRTLVRCDWLYLPEVVDSGRRHRALRRAVPPGQPAGLRRLRALPGGHGLPRLRARRRARPERAPHRRVPRLGPEEDRLTVHRPDQHHTRGPHHAPCLPREPPDDADPLATRRARALPRRVRRGRRARRTRQRLRLPDLRRPSHRPPEPSSRAPSGATRPTERISGDSAAKCRERSTHTRTNAVTELHLLSGSL